MRELNFYSNKFTSALLLIISSLFVIGVFFTREKILNFEENPFKSTMLFLGFLLFVFSIILSLLLLFRKKPLLTITNTQIIIYNVLAKKKVIDISNVESFFIVNNYHRGIATNRQIYIELKVPGVKYSSSWIYKFIAKFSKSIANSQYSIQTDFLNIKQKKLLEILNQLI
ncbi:MAG TPA: STM3941 family protein [Flavobacterium sp.]|nr:STM3941 family protein [Flavobacterium sp.]